MQIQFKINLPEDVKRWIAQEAEKNMRSQSAEIIFTLKEKMRREMDAQKADALRA
jgi:hypothetical protein